MPSVRCRCVDSCGVEETVWSFFRQLSFAGAIIALGFASVCSGQEGQPAKAPQERPLVTVSPEALAVHHRGFVFDGHNDLPWVVRTDASRSFDKLDIAQPQPKIHTDIPRLKQGGVGAPVLVGLCSGRHDETRRGASDDD